jgi:hypothetical protein
LDPAWPSSGPALNGQLRQDRARQWRRSPPRPWLARLPRRAQQAPVLWHHDL